MKPLELVQWRHSGVFLLTWNIFHTLLWRLYSTLWIGKLGRLVTFFKLLQCQMKIFLVEESGEEMVIPFQLRAAFHLESRHLIWDKVFNKSEISKLSGRQSLKNLL